MPRHPHIFASITHAFRGVFLTFREERNFRVQVLLGLLAVVLGVYFGLNRWEWMVLVIVSIPVLVVEVVNSIVERMIDLMKPRLHPVVHDVKDMMAGAVLLAAIGAVIVGAVVFVPKIVSLLQNGV